MDDVEWNENTKLDYYLAQIAAVIERFQAAFTEKAQEIKVSDKLIHFEVEKREASSEEEELEDSLSLVDHDKSFWLGFLGIQT